MREHILLTLSPGILGASVIVLAIETEGEKVPVDVGCDAGGGGRYYRRERGKKEGSKDEFCRHGGKIDCVGKRRWGWPAVEA